MADEFPGKVLIVDDDQDILKLYGDVLSKAGYKVEKANGGSEGYAKMLQGGYDLVLLDIAMPELDGITILRKIKQKQTEAQEQGSPQSFSYSGPVIVLSQMDQPQLIENAFSLGAKGYIVKAHIVPNELPDKISEILKKAGH